MADAIAALGRVDYRGVGLEDFGRPDGFLERQVPRWRKQLDGYSEWEGYPGPDIPGLEQVATWLDANRPKAFQPGILHGDFHMANVMFSNTGPELVAIVDWELCTIGDPLLDLGQLISMWPRDGEHGALSPFPDLPGEDELLARYAAGSTRDLSAIDWYVVLACYRLGIILEGTHARACAGKAPKATGDMLHATTVGLFERAVERIGSPTD